MEFDLTWVDPSLVICRTSGVAGTKGYEEFLRALNASPEYRPDVKVLMDVTQLDLSSFAAAEMEELANLRMRIAGERKARSAIVTGPSAARYGLGREFEAYLALRAEFEVRVFAEFDEALAWLRGTDTVIPPQTSSENVQTSS